MMDKERFEFMKKKHRTVNEMQDKHIHPITGFICKTNSKKKKKKIYY